jgi:thioredoxin-related protein
MAGPMAGLCLSSAQIQGLFLSRVNMVSAGLGAVGVHFSNVSTISTMKLLLKTSVAMMALYCSTSAFATSEGWTSDYAAAKKLAAESKKDLLLDFTNSDAGAADVKLHEEIFGQEAFKKAVKDTHVLVELDFSQGKAKLSEETMKQNKELAGKYALRGFPTVILADSEGKPFASTTYKEGGPEAYVKHLTELSAKKTKRDEALAKAAQSNGVDKAKALVTALATMGLADGMVTNFYSEVVAEIKAADPKDETGFSKADDTKTRLVAVQTELMGFAQKADHAGALALMDKSIKDGGFEPEDNQKFTLTRAMILTELKKFDEALAAVEQARELAPKSEIAGQIDSIKSRIEGMKKESTESPAPAKDASEPKPEAPPEPKPEVPSEAKPGAP